MELEENDNSTNNLELQKQSSMYHNPEFQVALQSNNEKTPVWEKIKHRQG